MATSEKSAPHLSDDKKEAEEDNTESPKDTESDMKAAIKISRQFMVLLEDYRYLMSCYEESCTCHVNFDYQYFSKKLDEKFNLLNQLSSNNSFLSNALEDDSDLKTLNELCNETQKSDKREAQQDNETSQYIKRIKITNDYQSSNFYQSDEDSNTGLTKYQSDRGNQFILQRQELQAFRCTHEKCDFISFTQDDVFRHIANHEGADSTKKRDKSTVLYVCSECSKEFSAQKWLTNHVENVHSNVKLYTCDYYCCNYKTKFRTCFEEHKKRHRAIREFKCIWEGCTSAFVTKRDMYAHVNFSHKRIKNHACTWPECAASFKDSNRLRHHYFTHTGERPYTCDVDGCDASFKQLPHLHKHRKTHETLE